MSVCVCVCVCVCVWWEEGGYIYTVYKKKRLFYIEYIECMYMMIVVAVVVRGEGCIMMGWVLAPTLFSFSSVFKSLSPTYTENFRKQGLGQDKQMRIRLGRRAPLRLQQREW